MKFYKRGLLYIRITSLILIACFIFALIPANQAIAAETEIRVMIDGLMLQTDVPPQIISNRLLIPFRAIFEALDADVFWDSEKRIAKCTKDNIYIEFPIGENEAIISGQKVLLDTPPAVVNGRVLIPLRFTSEALGAEVIWHEDIRLVEITTKSDPLPESEPTRGFVYNSVSLKRLDMGMQLSEMYEVIGYPDAIYPGERGFKWYLYNADSINTIHVGISDDGFIVALSTNSPYWKYLNHLENGQFLPSSYYVNETEFLVPYFDDINQGKVLGFSLYLKEAYSRQRIYTDDVLSGMERMLFDYTNTTRAIYNLSPLSWCDIIAKVADNHSLDMGQRLYFSHISPEGTTPWDRIRQEGINYISAAENLSYSVASAYNSLNVHSRWMNSEGHRKNILNEIFEFAGIGIVNSGIESSYIYVTQNLYKPKY